MSPRGVILMDVQMPEHGLVAALTATAPRAADGSA